MGTLFLLLMGAFIGWNFPQPWWAKVMQEKISGAIKNALRD